MSQDTGANPAAKHGLQFLIYLTSTWMPEPLWKSWSLFGRLRVSQLLKIPIDGVIPTTNHLEAFNGILKNKYIHSTKHGNKRVRFDLLIFLLATRILPELYRQRTVKNSYNLWLSDRFRDHAGGLIDASIPQFKSWCSSHTDTQLW